MVRLPDQSDLPDPIDNQGRWCRRGRDGKLYKAVWYWAGSVRWVPEGALMHRGPAGRVTKTYHLRYGPLDAFREWLRGGPIERASDERRGRRG